MYCVCIIVLFICKMCMYVNMSAKSFGRIKYVRAYLCMCIYMYIINYLYMCFCGRMYVGFSASVYV